MIITLSYRTYCSYGGHPTLELAARHINRHLNGDYRLGWDTIELIACTRSLSPPRRSLEEQYRSYHEWRRTLPEATPVPREGRLEFSYQAIYPLADELDRGGNLTISLGIFRRTIGTVESLAPRLLPRSPEASPDIDRLTADIRLATQSAPTTLDDLARDYLAADMTPSPTAPDSLKADAHPQSLRILTDPFYWDITDETTPFGNDTGSDVLDAFRHWRADHHTGSPDHILDLLLDQWGFAGGQPSNSEGRSVCNDAAIAIAFAQLLVDGCISHDIQSKALAAIKDEQSTTALARWGESATIRSTRLTAMHQAIVKAPDA